MASRLDEVNDATGNDDECKYCINDFTFERRVEIRERSGRIRFVRKINGRRWTRYFAIGFVRSGRMKVGQYHRHCQREKSHRIRSRDGSFEEQS